MSDWIRIAFVSKEGTAVSPIVALNYFSDCWEAMLCDVMPKMPASNPGSSLAAFVTECLAAVHPIWNRVDAVVDVDRWVILLPTEEYPIPGAERQQRLDPERFDRWPRRFARLVSLFQRRKPPNGSRLKH